MKISPDQTLFAWGDPLWEEIPDVGLLLKQIGFWFDGRVKANMRSTHSYLLALSPPDFRRAPRSYIECCVLSSSSTSFSCIPLVAVLSVLLRLPVDWVSCYVRCTQATHNASRSWTGGRAFLLRPAISRPDNRVRCWSPPGIQRYRVPTVCG